MSTSNVDTGIVFRGCVIFRGSGGNADAQTSCHKYDRCVSIRSHVLVAGAHVSDDVE